MSQVEAYRTVTKSAATDAAAYVTASRWAAKAALRIAAIKSAGGEAIKDRAVTKYVYEYEDAMREIDEALGVAKAKDDPKAMTSAIALKAKLSGLETEARKNERPPFEDMTEEQLVEGINRNLGEAGYTLQ